MDLSQFHSWWTLLLLVVFIGIVRWAYSARRTREFDRAARLPLEDDEDTKEKDRG